MGAKLEAEKTIQDLRITKKQGEKRKREVETIVPLKAQAGTKGFVEKRIRALKKKLKAIDDLVERQKGGEELDEQQLDKVARLDEVMQDMEEALREVDIDLNDI